ncbi:hypothetical protein M728_005709 (plasmid) [Ensifer sp. WSM1721]|uniref:hypothetical protein n=1 Tax=Ensifer sp. WSM1721 TaxID=1041159 RepID=UPI0004796AAB|nr:hypothetical protein [Ensifer sp. WSM1721]
MRDKHPRLFATDKELYDLMFSAKQRITDGVLHRLTRERGVFFGSATNRGDLADYISMTIHDLQDVIDLVKDAEPGTRGERTSSLTVKMKLDVSEIKDVIQEYANTDGKNDKVAVPHKTSEAVIATVGYSEFDLSRTTLAQRQDKVASLDFRIEDDGVVIRFPANDKGRELVDILIEKLESKKKSAVPQERITVEDLSPESRTRFFVNLVTKMTGFRLDTVTKLKVSAASTEIDDLDADEDGETAEQEVAKSAMINLVKNVALSGNDLLVSKQYKQMEEDGFFITSIKWEATQTAHPFDRVEFEASFENAQEGTGFQYRARHSRRSERTGTYPHNFKLPDDGVRKVLFSLLERTSRTVLAEIRRGRPIAKGGK